MAIISFRHKFIFVKTVKTAGTSLEIHLAAQCGPDDIVTPILPANPCHAPRNYIAHDGGRYFNHMPASLIRQMQPSAFAAFFKFCFERHPVDKCLSHFSMLKNSPHHSGSDNPKTWEEYLNRGDFPVDTARYVDTPGDPENGKSIVDKIYRYEFLDEALKDISRTIGIPEGLLLAREKSEFRNEAPSVEEVMAQPRQRDVIFKAFGSSLKLTPYE
jgi:hypothetical protein